MHARFRDRADAGSRLAQLLERRGTQDNEIVLSLPRGGFTVALEVARTLHERIDVFLACPIVASGSVIGAIASGGVTALDEGLIHDLGIARDVVDRLVVEALLDLDEREHAYRGGRAAVPLRGRNVLLVGDGMSSGPILRATVEGIRMFEPARVVIAAPVEVPAWSEWVRGEADDIVSVAHEIATAVWYDDASEPSDDDIRAALWGVAPRRRFPSRTQPV